jgi:hypothetical protein
LRLYDPPRDLATPSPTTKNRQPWRSQQGFSYASKASHSGAGILSACAPQFSWNSLLLLPDSLAALPILVAILLIIRIRRQTERSRLLPVMSAGALLGASCWLRANSLLLAPFLMRFFPLLYPRGKRAALALGLVGAACLVIAPLRIRNAIVFGRFIPISLGAGQTPLEGIADYNPDGTLGLPQPGLTRNRLLRRSLTILFLGH